MRLTFLDVDLQIMKTYNDKNNDDVVEKLIADELRYKVVDIINVAMHNKRMQKFKLRHAHWRKSIQSLLLKIRHLDRCIDLSECSHTMFDLSISIIDEVSIVLIFLLIKI